MHIQIETTDDTERERVVRLLEYTLHGHRADIGSIQLTVTTLHDALGIRLSRCRLRTWLSHGQPIEIVEVQSSLDLAVTRSLQRCIRTIRRREITTQGHID